MLFASVALMWVSWARGKYETANRLLRIRERSKSICSGMHEDEAWEILGLGSRFVRGPRYNRQPITDPRPVSASIWMGCSLKFRFSIDRKVKTFSMEADWPAIEKKARDENRIYYYNVILTALASLLIGSVLLGGLIFGPRLAKPQ
jgi:hypothetical protein